MLLNEVTNLTIFVCSIKLIICHFYKTNNMPHQSIVTIWPQIKDANLVILYYDRITTKTRFKWIYGKFPSNGFEMCHQESLWTPPMYDIRHISAINTAVTHNTVLLFIWIYIPTILIGYIKLYNEVYWTRRLILLIVVSGKPCLLITRGFLFTNYPENLVY